MTADLDERLTAAAPRPAERCITEPEFDVGRLTAWREGALTEAEAEPVIAHLAACAWCRDLLADIEPLSPGDTDRLVGGRGPMWPVAVTTLAAAAAVLLMLWPTAPTPLPDYVAGSPTGGIAAVKSNTPASLRYGPNSQVTWQLRPTVRTEPPEARAYVEYQGTLRALPDTQLTRLPGGTLRLQANASDLFRGPSGERTLRVAIVSDASDLAPDGSAWPGDHGGVWFAVTVHWEASVK